MRPRNDDVIFREAADGDWPRIWPFWQRIVAAGDSYMWAPGTDERTAESLWMLPPPARVFVAEAGTGRDDGTCAAGAVVASALLKPNQPGLGDHVANAAFMVDPAYAGSGLGRRMTEYVLDQARRQGYRAMQFNAVVETNTAAVALWRSLGFTVLATVPEAFRHPVRGLVGMHIMHRAL